MVVDAQQSLVRVTSEQDRNSDFGTGFVIHRDESKTYVLTCAHIVRDVGGPENVRVGGRLATVVAIGEPDGIDLAVVMVEGLLDRSSLTMQTAGLTGTPISITGYSEHGQSCAVRQLRGELRKPFQIESAEQTSRAEAWDIEITDEDNLEKLDKAEESVDKLVPILVKVSNQLLLLGSNSTKVRFYYKKGWNLA